MEFYKIKFIEVVCPDCQTTITIKYLGENSTDKKFHPFACPCCEYSLKSEISSAVHCAYEYNKACEAIEELQQNAPVRFDD